MDSQALYKLTYGLFLLTAREDGRDNGCIINTAIQVANDPTRISVAVIRNNHTRDMICRAGVFNVSALTTEAEFSLFQRFGMQSGRDTDKFAGFDAVARSANGLYYLAGPANMYLSARVVAQMELGSHTLFIGELTDAKVLSEVPSCTYGYYQSHIKPKPRAAGAGSWVCSVCGYVYEGDEVPDDYLCPQCSHGKADFVRADSGPVAPAPAPASGGERKFVCSVCGHVHTGDAPPAECPICHVGREKFVEQSGGMSWAAEHVVGVANGAPEDIIMDLRSNFEGECSEVGMYLAMARAAHREGCPEIGLYWEKAAWEEAEHAAKFAELLGEVVTDSTRKNLELRVEAEFGATAGKVRLADRARELGLDAIADTVMEMAKDEARHGKALKGLLEKYFTE